MLHARLVRSLYAHARIVRVGRICVPAELRRAHARRRARAGSYGCQIRDQTVVAVDRVRHVGDPVAAVAAPTPREAEEAAALVAVDYEELEAVFDPVEAAARRAARARDARGLGEPGCLFRDPPDRGHQRLPSLPASPRGRRRGLRRGRRDRRGDLPHAGAQHCHMEPHACLAVWEGGFPHGLDGDSDAVQRQGGSRARLRAASPSGFAWSARRWAARSAPRPSSGSRRWRRLWRARRRAR